MALITQCPRCNTSFRVAADQLKLRGGIVRCGACNEVFDGNAALQRQPEMAALSPVPAPVATAPAPFVPSPQLDKDSAPQARAPAASEPALFLPEFIGEPEALAQPEVIPEPEVLPESEVEPEPDVEPEPEVQPEPEVGSEVLPETELEPGLVPEPEVRPEPELEPEHVPQPAAEPAPEPAPAPTHEAEEPQLLLTAPELALLLAGPEPTPLLTGPEPRPLLAAPVASYEDDTHFPFDPDEADRTFAPLAEHVAHGADGEHAHLTSVQRAAARRKALAQKRAEEIAAAAVEAPEETVEAASDAAEAPAHAPEPDLPPDDAVSDDEPDFVRRARVHERATRRRRILMGVGSVLLLLALAWQALTSFRDVLAARFPQLRPVIEASCVLLHCRIELPAQIDELSVETGELQTLDPTTLAYVTLLRNNGAIVQAWPQLELTLTDANDRPVLRRVLSPAEYLPSDMPPARGFAPASEQPVKLYFKLDQIKASGYRIAIFYP